MKRYYSTITFLISIILSGCANRYEKEDAAEILKLQFPEAATIVHTGNLRKMDYDCDCYAVIDSHFNLTMVCFVPNGSDAQRY